VLRLILTAIWSWHADRLHSKKDRAEMREALEVLQNWADAGVEPPNSIDVDYVFFLADPRMAFRTTLAMPRGTENASLDEAARAVWALREVIGNPFRPVAFDAAWRTDTVLSLARHMYESRDFSAMPILADALQDAGCDHDDILNHCRDANGVHVRGCWVVDLVLGKE